MESGTPIQVQHHEKERGVLDEPRTETEGRRCGVIIFTTWFCDFGPEWNLAEAPLSSSAK